MLADRYRLEAELGRGGMGTVYLARHLALGRPLAIKLLDADAEASPWAVARFLREARLAARVRHPNIVDIYDFGSTPEGLVYIVMEALVGRDLRTIVRAGRLDWAWSRFVIRQVCAGVEAIHRAGVVHRDIKASNCVLVEASRQIKILDFGIATDHLPGPWDPNTQAGAPTVVGTPEYMAPEQIRGAPADHRSDVYAIGILLFELLTGATPFAGRTAEHVFERQLHDPVPTLRSQLPELDAPDGLDAVLARALAKQPRRRFQTVAELARALDRVDDGRPLRRWFGVRAGACAQCACSRACLGPPPRGLARDHDEHAPTLRSRGPRLRPASPSSPSPTSDTAEQP